MNKKKFILGLLLILLSGTAHADPWSLKLGIGRGSYALCGLGCWAEPPLPYSDDKNPGAVEIGVHYQLSEHLGLEALYHNFQTASVTGHYTQQDSDYNSQTGWVRPNCPMWAGTVSQRLYGISLAVVPQVRFNKTTLFAKGGLFWWHEHTEWHGTSYLDGYSENGGDHTPMVGVGLEYHFTNVSLGLEYDAFQSVVHANAPFGSSSAGRMAGLTQIMLTMKWKI